MMIYNQRRESILRVPPPYWFSPDHHVSFGRVVIDGGICITKFD